MKDLILTIPIVLAQLPAESWERLGFLGTSLMVTVVLWKYFTDRDAQTSARDAAERNRLMEENNGLQKQIVALLHDQLKQQSHITIDNQPNNPVQTKESK